MIALQSKWDAGQVGLCLFMAHVDAIIVLLPEDTVVESGKVIWINLML